MRWMAALGWSGLSKEEAETCNRAYEVANDAVAAFEK
jgi:hypothetical protein